MVKRIFMGERTHSRFHNNLATLRESTDILLKLSFLHFVTVFGDLITDY